VRVPAVAAFLVFAVAATAASASVRPSLRLLASNPVVVAGRGFEPLEHVIVKVRTDDALLLRRVRATRAGRFRLVFATLLRDPCASSLSVLAVGRGGSRAVLRLGLRACPFP
jgi:hypothetical protein